MKRRKIFVTKSFLPSKEDFYHYIDSVYAEGKLTNQGPLLLELEDKLSHYLGIDSELFHYVTNGTIAIQVALNALDIKAGEIITTPFSYVATTSSILWERCTPVFVDIEPNNFTIDPAKIEQAITPQTKAILAVHVFGYMCDVESIQKIAEKYNLKVIYDAAHAFGSFYHNKSLLNFGDISTCSFHATKLFHTIEGGAIIANNEELSKKIELIKRFGHHGDEHYMLGINAKQSEIHAAMGLANYPYINEIIKERKIICNKYDELLSDLVQRPTAQKDLDYNYAYYPVVFKSEEELLNVFATLEKEDIYPRRYFYPSLNTLPYLASQQSCPISEDISLRIACLPLYPGLKLEDVEIICQIIKKTLKQQFYSTKKYPSI